MTPETALIRGLFGFAGLLVAWLAIVVGVAAVGRVTRLDPSGRWLLRWAARHRTSPVIGLTCTLALTVLPRPAAADDGDEGGVAVMIPLEPPVDTLPAPPAPPATAPEPPSPPAQAAHAPIDDTWTVEPGDHLWHIAEETLVDDGLDASDPAIARYVDSLVEWNREVLVDPANPDLIYPGQVIRVREVGSDLGPRG
jgi:hypothetical protein